MKLLQTAMSVEHMQKKNITAWNLLNTPVGTKKYGIITLVPWYWAAGSKARFSLTFFLVFNTFQSFDNSYARSWVLVEQIESGSNTV